MQMTPRIAVVLGILTMTSAAQAQQLSAHESYLVNLINTARAQAALPPLTVDLRVSAVARNHSYDMASNWFFGHTSPTTGDVHARLQRAKVPYSTATQNIAYASSAAAAHDSLMRQSSNRDVILDRRYSHVGVGIIPVGGRLMVTENFISVAGSGGSPWGRVARPLPSPWVRPNQPSAAPAAPRPIPQAAPQPAAVAPQPAPRPEPERRRRHHRDRSDQPQQCALQGRWQGIAQDGLLRGRPVTFDFWGVGNGTARGSSGSISLESRWVRQGNTVSITDIRANPSIAACNPGQTGRYTISFSEDCQSVHIVSGDDSCSHRSMTMRGLQARRVE